MLQDGFTDGLQVYGSRWLGVERERAYQEQGQRPRMLYRGRSPRMPPDKATSPDVNDLASVAHKLGGSSAYLEDSACGNTQTVRIAPPKAGVRVLVR